MVDPPICVASNQPIALPTSAMNAAWFEPKGNLVIQSGAPPQAEIDFATKDAQCRESSGYNNRAYEMHVAYLEQDIAAHQDRYESIKRKIAEKTPQVKAYLDSP